MRESTLSSNPPNWPEKANSNNIAINNGKTRFPDPGLDLLGLLTFFS